MCLATAQVRYDGAAEITAYRYRNAADTATIVGFEHAYDKSGNPKYEVRNHQSGKGDEYTFDALYRLTRVVYDDDTPATPTAAPPDSGKVSGDR